MKVFDTTDRFGGVSIVNHWTLMALVVVLLASGLLIAEVLPESAGEALIPVHKWIGVLSVVVIVWMAFWRFTQKSHRPGPVEGTTRIEALIRAVMHAALLVGVVILGLSGVQMSIFSGHDVSVLGLFTIPAQAPNESIAGFAHTVHTVIGWAMVVAVAAHAAVGVKHHVIDRDATFLRMLGRSA